MSPTRSCRSLADWRARAAAGRCFFLRDFKVTIIQRQITRKWYNIELYLRWPTNRKSYMICRTAPFSMTLNDPYPQFQGRSILWRWIFQKRYEIHSFNGTLIGTYTRLTRHCHFTWPWQQNIQWHEALRGISATAEFLVFLKCAAVLNSGLSFVVRRAL